MKKLNEGEIEDTDLNPEYDYEIIRVFDSQFTGTCVIDRSHTVRRGDRVAKLQLASNPMLPVTGVACKACTWALPLAKEDGTQV